MSSKEIAKKIIDSLPDYKMDYIVAFLKGFQLDDEIEDDLFCERLVDEYINDPSPDKEESISIEKFAEELGIELP